MYARNQSISYYRFDEIDSDAWTITKIHHPLRYRPCSSSLLCFALELAFHTSPQSLCCLQSSHHPFRDKSYLIRAGCILRRLVFPYTKETRKAKRYPSVFYLYPVSSIQRAATVRRHTNPCAAAYTGLKLRSAVSTSHTILGTNQMSGLAAPTLTSPRTLSISSGLRVS